MIEIQELTFKYKGAQKNALENVSVKIEKGDFVGIIGESGAGKTTLCSCLNGLIPHHFTGDFYGSVKVEGQDTFEIKPDKLALKVGSVFQNIESQIISYFVEDEILFGLENFGVPKDQIERRITNSLAALEISDLRHREISTLSGGQKQKVVFASILALEPDYLILDEPTGELDPASSLQIFKLLKKLNEEKGITIIIAEQKIMLLCEFVKKLLVLEKGKVVHYGEIRSTLTHQKEMEEAGINCPRVLTLTGKMMDEGLTPAGMKKEERICLNTTEAAEFVKKIIKKDYRVLPANDTSSMSENDNFRTAGNDNGETVLEFKDVSFCYNSTANVNSLNIKINKGDFTAIIGSNGAGKSTVSKLSNGLLQPGQGDVLVLGKNTKKNKVSNLAKHIGFLFQNPDRQICCNTVEEEIAFSLKNNRLSAEEIKKRVEKTIRDFDFNAKTEPFNMSRGQRQRLCLACLIALNPEILILDEPTTGLDYRECMEIMSHIRKLNENGTTVIMVCHDMEVVLDFAKEVIVMNKGQILAQGKTRTILSDTNLLKRARLLQPQIAATCSLLGDQFNNIFTVDEMINTLKQMKKGGKSK
ncbi:MAG: ABC transporter ATP-binding protein [Treponema sp.]|nr:ABC transporter ATP-binding protein [Treponema sp.]